MLSEYAGMKGGETAASHWQRREVLKVRGPTMGRFTCKLRRFSKLIGKENLVHHSLPTQVAIRKDESFSQAPSHQQPVRAALRLLHLPCRYLEERFPRSCQGKLR
ncbi:hypothetical protein NCS56_00261900 [Fusarium sp. Ph1]|nr:hypothetical protein NCS56_00261900 [Fusarium sp. Ph1]